MKNVLWCAVVLSALDTLMAGAPDVIGTASARGCMRVKGAGVLSNPTLFDSRGQR